MIRSIFEAIRGPSKNKNLNDRAKIIEDVLYGQLSSPDSEAVQAVAQLTSALCSNQCAGVVDAGVFIFFKVKNDNDEFQIFSKRLTIKERAIINNAPTLLKNPYRILEDLENAIALDHDRAEELRLIAASNSDPTS